MKLYYITDDSEYIKNTKNWFANRLECEWSLKSIRYTSISLLDDKWCTKRNDHVQIESENALNLTKEKRW